MMCLNALNAISTVVVAVATLALAVITLCYVIITKRMLYEMKRGREMSPQPMLSARLVLWPQQMTDTPFTIKGIVLKNIGNAPALGTKIVTEVHIGTSVHREETFQGQIGIEEREIELNDLLRESQKITSDVQETIKQIHAGNEVSHKTFSLRMSYLNSYGIAFEGSQVFKLDLRPHKPAWKLSSQDHRVMQK